MRRSPILLAAALLAAGLLASACDGESGAPGPVAASADRPSTEVALPTPREASEATGPYPGTAVTVSVGRRFGVRGVTSMTAFSWDLASAGDAAVVRQDQDVVVEPCGSQTGCSPGVDHVFTALTPGSTTLTWVFRPRFGCPSPPDASSGTCGNVTKTFQVTVR